MQTEPPISRDGIKDQATNTSSTTSSKPPFRNHSPTTIPFDNSDSESYRLEDSDDGTSISPLFRFITDLKRRRKSDFALYFTYDETSDTGALARSLSDDSFRRCHGNHYEKAVSQHFAHSLSEEHNLMTLPTLIKSNKDYSFDCNNKTGASKATSQNVSNTSAELLNGRSKTELQLKSNMGDKDDSKPVDYQEPNVKSSNNSNHSPDWKMNSTSSVTMEAHTRSVDSKKESNEEQGFPHNQSKVRIEVSPPKTAWQRANEANMAVVDRVLDYLLNAKEVPSGSLKLEASDIEVVLFQARTVLLGQPSLLDVEAPVTICGDIHGQFYDLLQLFEVGGAPGTQTRYLFLGDYVDRGRHSVEVTCLLLALKVKYPHQFHLIRGNHECSNINRLFGFYDECRRRYSYRLWKKINDCFNCLPFAATVDDKIFCCHGGLSPELRSVEQIKRISRPTKIPEEGLLADLVWADPNPKHSGWERNLTRAISYTFGMDVLNKFLIRHRFELVVRGHEVPPEGFMFHGKKQMVTLHSAPNYGGVHGNDGAFMTVDKNLMCSFKILKPIPKRAVYKFTSNALSVETEFVSHVTESRNSIDLQERYDSDFSDDENLEDDFDTEENVGEGSKGDSSSEETKRKDVAILDICCSEVHQRDGAKADGCLCPRAESPNQGFCCMEDQTLPVSEWEQRGRWKGRSFWDLFLPTSSSHLLHSVTSEGTTRHDFDSTLDFHESQEALMRSLDKYLEDEPCLHSRRRSSRLANLSANIARLYSELTNKAANGGGRPFLKDTNRAAVNMTKKEWVRLQKEISQDVSDAQLMVERDIDESVEHDATWGEFVSINNKRSSRRKASVTFQALANTTRPKSRRRSSGDTHSSSIETMDPEHPYYPGVPSASWTFNQMKRNSDPMDIPTNSEAIAYSYKSNNHRQLVNAPDSISGQLDTAKSDPSLKSSEEETSDEGSRFDGSTTSSSSTHCSESGKDEDDDTGERDMGREDSQETVPIENSMEMSLLQNMSV